MANAATAKAGNEMRSVSDLEAEIKLLRADIEKLTEQLQRTGEHGIGAARRAASQGAEQLRAKGEETVESLRQNARDIEAQITENVREKPISSLAIAAGVGFLFALIARR